MRMSFSNKYKKKFLREIAERERRTFQYFKRRMTHYPENNLVIEIGDSVIFSCSKDYFSFDGRTIIFGTTRIDGYLLDKEKRGWTLEDRDEDIMYRILEKRAHGKKQDDLSPCFRPQALELRKR